MPDPYLGPNSDIARHPCFRYYPTLPNMLALQLYARFLRATHTRANELKRFDGYDLRKPILAYP